MFFLRAARNRFICPGSRSSWQCFCVLFAAASLAASSAWAQSYVVQRIASGLDSPTYIVQAPGDDGSLYITELGGAIKKLDLASGVVTPFASLARLFHTPLGRSL